MKFLMDFTDRYTDPVPVCRHAAIFLTYSSACRNPRGRLPGGRR